MCDNENQCLRPANANGQYVCLHIGHYTTWRFKNECALLEFSGEPVLFVALSLINVCVKVAFSRFKRHLCIPLKVQRL